MGTSSALKLADLALVWGTGSADLALIDSDLASDAGMETAIMLSLFTDRRALDDDVPPSGDPDDRRGWWADQFATVEGDRFGSKLWLLDRSTITNETALKAEQYDRDALQWMIDDSVVESIDIEVDIKTIPGDLLHAVTLHRPSREPLTLRFAHAWDGVTAQTSGG